jgi:RNA polymerase sigma-70 factor (ECF subfamily)
MPVPTCEPSDADLLPRLRARDAAALETVMRRHNERLYRVARAVVHDEHEAEDVVQEAYVRAFTGLARFRGEASLATWLTRIAFHEALRRRRRQRLAARHQQSHTLTDDTDTPPMERTEHTAELARAVDTLPDSLRPIVMLRLVQGLSTRETAESLRLSEASVKVGLHRARRMMVERLEPSLREQFAFPATRCDRVVAGVLERLGC